MAEKFLVSVDLKNFLHSTASNGLGLKTIFYLNNVLINVTTHTFQDALSYLQKRFSHAIIFCDCVALDKVDDILALLNAGATKAFVTEAQIKAIIQHGLLQDLGRLVLALERSYVEGDPEDEAEVILGKVKALDENTNLGIQVDNVHNWELLEALKSITHREGRPQRYVKLREVNEAQYVKAIKGGHVPIVPATELTQDPKRHPDLFPAHLLITTAIHSDRPDELFPTLVTNELGIGLGLVYSDSESIEAALRTGSGAYHSRSRDGLWIKGEESGDTQDLISISWDCDADALQFRVRQKGDGTFSLL